MVKLIPLLEVRVINPNKTFDLVFVSKNFKEIYDKIFPDEWKDEYPHFNEIGFDFSQTIDGDEYLILNHETDDRVYVKAVPFSDNELNVEFAYNQNDVKSSKIGNRMFYYVFV